MTRSMTSYGRSIRNCSSGDWVIEIHSVNKKNSLDFHLLIPKEFLFLDLDIRKWLSSFFKRGQITVKIQLKAKNKARDILPCIAMMKELKEEIELACLSIGCQQGGISFPFLYEIAKEHAPPPVLDEDLVRADLFFGLEEATRACLQMKEMEGASLVAILQKNLEVIQNLLSQIEGHVVGLRKRYEEKLLTKFQMFSKEITAEDQERLLREVFFYLEKMDVTEEIERIRSHVEQFIELLSSASENGVGKTMEFLLQEMGREMNTFCAKTEELDITRLGLLMRGELEKMKEQVQNIE